MKKWMENVMAKAQVKGTEVLVKAQGRLNQFRQEERGDALTIIIGALIAVLLLLGIYLAFKSQINTYIEKIFGKMSEIN
ncbi:hypothetical protein [Paenibacillus graminis]|uniref:hypothetical protein n=1 Tax=Paenibacillus graminis TaxID=189425 RepID=UPI002DBF30AD|nr:hypothetical protein [Paenibacillus graminis]MEC0167370.1 hypothetical protein [Paenibacillus graminis]